MDGADRVVDVLQGDGGGGGEIDNKVIGAGQMDGGVRGEANHVVDADHDLEADCRGGEGAGCLFGVANGEFANLGLTLKGRVTEFEEPAAGRDDKERIATVWLVKVS